MKTYLFLHNWIVKSSYPDGLYEASSYDMVFFIERKVQTLRTVTDYDQQRVIVWVEVSYDCSCSCQSVSVNASRGSFSLAVTSQWWPKLQATKTLFIHIIIKEKIVS